MLLLLLLLRMGGGVKEEAPWRAGGGVELEATLALSEPDFLFSTIGFISSFSLPTKSKFGRITTSRESCDIIVDRKYFRVGKVLLHELK